MVWPSPLIASSFGRVPTNWLFIASPVLISQRFTVKSSLAEMTVWAGEKILDGEVLAKDRAEEIYQEEKSRGNDVGNL